MAVEVVIGFGNAVVYMTDETMSHYGDELFMETTKDHKMLRTI